MPLSGYSLNVLSLCGRAPGRDELLCTTETILGEIMIEPCDIPAAARRIRRVADGTPPVPLRRQDRMVAECAGVIGIAAVLAGNCPRLPSRSDPPGRPQPDMALLIRVVTGQDIVLGDTVVKGRPHAA